MAQHEINRLASTADALSATQANMSQEIHSVRGMFNSIASQIPASAMLTSPSNAVTVNPTTAPPGYPMYGNSMGTNNFQSTPTGNTNTMAPGVQSYQVNANTVPTFDYNKLSAEQQQLLILNMNKLNGTLNYLENAVKDHDQLISDFQHRLNENDQYLRRNSLLAIGMKPPTEKEKLRGFKFADFVCEELNKLYGDKLTHPLSSEKHIDAAHVLPTRNKKKTVIIIQFISRIVRNEVFYAKRVLKQTGISICEHLTTHQLKLLDKTRNVLGKNVPVWTNQGTIFALVDNKKIPIRHDNDLKRLYYNNISHDRQSYSGNQTQYYTEHSTPQESSKTEKPA